MSSQTMVRREPPMTVVRTLVGLSQLTCDVDKGASGQPHRQVGHAGSSRPDRVTGVGGHRRRHHMLREHEVQDRQVMRGEVPEHVHVRLHEAQVDPDRVHELDLADLPRLG